MKRDDMKVGDVLFWAANQDWWNRDYDTGKATVVALWATHQRFSYGHYEVAPHTRGAGVLVAVEQPAPWYTKDGDAPKMRTTQKVVPPGQLRGPYEEIKAQRDAHQKEERTAHTRAERERDAAQAKASALITRVQTLVTGATDYQIRYEGHSQTISMAPWVLEKLLGYIPEELVRMVDAEWERSGTS